MIGFTFIHKQQLHFLFMQASCKANITTNDLHFSHLQLTEATILYNVVTNLINSSTYSVVALISILLIIISMNNYFNLNIIFE